MANFFVASISTILDKCELRTEMLDYQHGAGTLYRKIDLPKDGPGQTQDGGWAHRRQRLRILKQSCRDSSALAYSCRNESDY